MNLSFGLGQVECGPIGVVRCQSTQIHRTILHVFGKHGQQIVDIGMHECERCQLGPGDGFEVGDGITNTVTRTKLAVKQTLTFAGNNLMISSPEVMQVVNACGEDFLVNLHQLVGNLASDAHQMHGRSLLLVQIIQSMNAYPYINVQMVNGLEQTVEHGMILDLLFHHHIIKIQQDGNFGASIVKHILDGVDQILDQFGFKCRVNVSGGYNVFQLFGRVGFCKNVDKDEAIAEQGQEIGNDGGFTLARWTNQDHVECRGVLVGIKLVNNVKTIILDIRSLGWIGCRG